MNKLGTYSNYLIFSLSLILAVLPIALVTGPFLPDLICVISVLIFFVFIIINKEYYLLKNFLFIIFIIWSIYLIINSLFSSNYLLSLESSLFYFRFGILVLCFYLCLKYNSNFLNYIKFVLIITYSIIIFDSLFQYIFEINIFGFSYDGRRLSSFFGEEKILGSYLARLYPLLFGLMMYKKKSSSFFNFINISLFILTYLVVFLSGERTAFFLINLSYFIIFLIFPLKKIFKFLIFSSIISLISLISIINRSLFDRIFYETFNGFDLFNGGFTFFTFHHELLYIASLKMFLSSPFFGVGPKIFRDLCKNESFYNVNGIIGIDSSVKDSCSTHSHNTYIQLLAETGIIGTLPVLILFIFILILFIKYLKNSISKNIQSINYLCFGSFLCLFLSLWPLVPAGNFFNNWLSLVYYLPIGFFFFSYRQEEIFFKI